MPNIPNDPIDAARTSRRRVVLMSAAVTVAGTALAACSSGSATSVTPSGTTGMAPAGSGSGADPATTASTASSAGSADGMATGMADGTEPTPAAPSSRKTAKTGGTAKAAKGALARLSDIPMGGSVIVAGVVIARPSATRVVGHSPVCTHQGCSVAAGGRTLNCPCHGAQFDAFTGAVKKGPARTPLARIGLIVTSGYVHRA
jgi:Rieske Fe-S protein